MWLCGSILLTWIFKGTTSTENFGTGVGVDPSDYESYTLAQVRDTLSIAGLSAAKTDFNLITKESAGFLNDPFDGIIGELACRMYDPISGLVNCLVLRNGLRWSGHCLSKPNIEWSSG